MSASKWKPYPEYKETEYSWIGEIPEHWGTCKVKHLFELSKERVTEENPQILSLTQKGIKKRDISNFEGQIAATYDGYHKVNIGDIVFNPMDLRSGFVDSSSFAGIISPAYTILKPIAELSKSFYGRWFQRHYLELIFWPFGKGVSYEHRWTLGNETLLNFPIVKPPLEEQEKIARVISNIIKTTSLLESKLLLKIELLEKKRVSLIVQAVTKGLNLEAEMEDSEIDWLGRIPSHWDMTSLKFFCMFQRGHDLPSDSRIKGKIPVVSSGGISGWHNESKAKPPGIVTGRYGSIGVFHFIEQEYWPLNTSLYSTNFYDNHPKYVLYAMSVLSPLFHLESSKSAVPGVDRNDLFNYKITKPPYVEQELIANYIEQQSKLIDKMVSESTLKINMLKEYRTALISAAVTGKIDVRGL